MSNIIDINLISALSDLGLNEKESRVYIALLEEGDMSAIGISKAVELHRQFVYNALSALKEKGLVLQISKAPAKWRAQNPRKFIAIAEERERQAANVVEALLPLMIHRAAQEFEVTEGVKAFRSKFIETIRRVPKGSTVRMITGEWEKYFERAGEAHKDWDRIRIEKEIYFRIIGPAAMRVDMEKAKATRALTEYKVFPGLEKNLVNTVIYDDQVVMEIYGDPHITFNIKNKDVAESQKRFFEALWNQSTMGPE